MIFKAKDQDKLEKIKTVVMIIQEVVEDSFQLRLGLKSGIKGVCVCEKSLDFSRQLRRCTAFLINPFQASLVVAGICKLVKP